MGFSSYDDMITEIETNQKRSVVYLRKFLPAGAIGTFGEAFATTALGDPSGGAWDGVAGVATSLTSASVGAICPLDNVSPDTRHLLVAEGGTASVTTAPSHLILVDYLLYYPALVATGVPTVPDNTVTLPRYTNGVGVMGFWAVQSTLGATTATFATTYNGAVNGTGQVSPVSALANIVTVAQLAGSDVRGPFLDMAEGDTGIKQLESYTIGGVGTTGTMVFVLCKPLCRVPLMPAVGFVSDRNYAFNIPTLPRIYDGACLGFIVYNAVATALGSFRGSIELGWG